MAHTHLLHLLLLLPFLSIGSSSKCYTSLFSFGDSATATGLQTTDLVPGRLAPHCAFHPYGTTFFHKPTGRCSDGRLIVDFLSRHSSKQRNDYLNNSLILLGEIGGVDYQRASVENAAVESLIPIVVKRIRSAIETLIKFGAVNFLIPGDFPKGCFPSYLTRFQSKNESEYDSRTGCLIYHNRFSDRHNQMLRKEIRRVGKLHPKVSIRYADYYGSAMRMHLNPKKYGFARKTMNMACCGAGGPYNYNRTAVCGRAGAVACGDPNAYIKWDDHHYTDSANRVIARDVFRAGFPRCL
ncbi:GDSL esterase/lipase At1g28610 [Linum grandiflorum]